MTTGSRAARPAYPAKVARVRHLGDEDGFQDILWALKDMTSFRTWALTGLRSRSRSDYYNGFAFDNPGQLPTEFAELYLRHSNKNLYTVFIGDTPIVWYHSGLGWIAPKLDGFTEPHTTNDYEKVYNVVMTLTGKGASV